MTKTEKIDRFFAQDSSWKKDLLRLREIILRTELEEDWKWSFPVYTLSGKNVVGLGCFKHHYGVWFFQGVFLKDEDNVLINAQKGKTKAMRQLRFEKNSEFDEDLVASYIKEAIVNQKKGLEVKIDRKSTTISAPGELQRELENDHHLYNAFEQLTPGKRKEYNQFVSQAKRAETKQRRLEKIKPLILAGHGLNDQYKK